MRSVSKSRVVDVIVFVAISIVLLTRPGHWSLSYQVMVGLSVFVVVLSVRELVRHRPVTNVAERPWMDRPSMRMLFAVLPWLVVLGVVVADGLWWTQQDWRARLFAAYLLLAYPLFSAPASPPSASKSSGALGAFLLFLSRVGILVALDGLAFGTLPFGVQISAAIGAIAAALGVAARYGGEKARERLVTASIGVLFGLVVVEIGVRVMNFGGSLQEVDDPEYVRLYHHISPPGTKYVNQPKPLDEFPPAVVEINSIGIRGPEIPPGPVDMLLIGDSMIEARQLPWEQILSAKLPAALAARGSKARAVGHGVRGWSPLLEWNWYLKSGRKLHPKNVLLFFFWNDLWVAGDEVRTFSAVVGPDGRPDHFEQAVDPAWVWYKHVRTVRVAGDILQRLQFSSVTRTLSMVGAAGGDMDSKSAEDTAQRMAADGQLSPAEVDELLTKPVDQLSPRLKVAARSEFWPSFRPMSLWNETQLTAVGKTEQELRMFAEDVAADGGRLVIVFVPNAFQISASECRVARRLAGFQDDRLLPEQSGIQEWIRGVADRNQIELIDPSDTMRKFLNARPAGSPPLYLRADCHWAEPGHQFMADFVADWYVRTREGR